MAIVMWQELPVQLWIRVSLNAYKSREIKVANRNKLYLVIKRAASVIRQHCPYVKEARNFVKRKNKAEVE